MGIALLVNRMVFVCHIVCCLPCTVALQAHDRCSVSDKHSDAKQGHKSETEALIRGLKGGKEEVNGWQWSRFMEG